MSTFQELIEVILLIAITGGAIACAALVIAFIGNMFSPNESNKIAINKYGFSLTMCLVVSAIAYIFLKIAYPSHISSIKIDSTTSPTPIAAPKSTPFVFNTPTPSTPTPLKDPFTFSNILVQYQGSTYGCVSGYPYLITGTAKNIDSVKHFGTANLIFSDSNNTILGSCLVIISTPVPPGSSIRFSSSCYENLTGEQMFYSEPVRIY